MQKENYSPLFVPHHCWLGEQLRGQCDETSSFWTFLPSQAGKLSVSYVFSNSTYKATLDFVSFLIFLISFFSWRSIFSFHCFRRSSFLFRNPVKNSFRALSSNTTFQKQILGDLIFFPICYTFVFAFPFLSLLSTLFSLHSSLKSSLLSLTSFIFSLLSSCFLSLSLTFVLVFLLIALLGTVFSVPMLPGSEMLNLCCMSLFFSGWKSNLLRDWIVHRVQWWGQRLVSSVSFDNENAPSHHEILCGAHTRSWHAAYIQNTQNSKTPNIGSYHLGPVMEHIEHVCVWIVNSGHRIVVHKICFISCGFCIFRWAWSWNGAQWGRTPGTSGPTM